MSRVFDRLGISGVLGVLMLLIGISVIAYENLLIGAGIALVLAGTGLVANGIVQSALRTFGMK